MAKDQYQPPEGWGLRGDEIARLVAGTNWAATPLGSRESWSAALESAVEIILASAFPMALRWGADFVLIYNDAYRPILGDKHPSAMGRSVRDVYAELWDDIAKPHIDLLNGAPAMFAEDLPLRIQRDGDRVENVRFTVSYSPLKDATAPMGIGGILITLMETTEQVEADQRLTAERDRQREALQQMPGFVGVVSGPDFIYEYVNDAYVKISQRTDFIGRGFKEVFPDIAEQGFFELLDSVYRSGEGKVMRNMELRLHGATEPQYIDFVFEPIRNDDGEVSGIFIGGYDVSDAVRAQARLLALAELSEALREAADPEALPLVAAEILGRALGVSRVGYGAIDDDAETLHVQRDWTAPGVDSLAGATPLREYGSFIDSLRANEFIAINDVREDDRTAPAAEALESRDARSFVNVPVVEHGRLAAVLYVNHAAARAWRPDELSLIQDVAERTFAAVERLRGAAALSESETRYRTLFEAVDVGFCVVEMKFDEAGSPIDYRMVEINPAFEHQTGLYGAHGKWMSEVAPGLERHWFVLYGRVATTGEAIRFENEAAPFGRWYDVHAFRSGTAEQRRVAILFNDITERREAEAALQDLNARLESLAAERMAERDQLWTLSQDMLARADYTGMMTSVSPAWTDVLGWSEAELLSRGYATFMHPDDEGPTLKAIGGMAETGRPTRFENRIATKDGGWKSIEWVVTPEADGQNFIANGRDMSAAKDRERELEAAHEALRQSQKMEAVGQLTGGIAHDFNNLLAAISGSLELVEKRMSEGRMDSLSRLIGVAQQSADRAAALTQRLLAFSRRQTLDPRPTDINRLVAGMGDLLRRTVGPSVELEIVQSGGLWLTKVDVSQLENGLLNLVINGRDAMPDGGRITVETANRWLDDRTAKPRDLPPGQYVSLCVTDTGEGMTAEVIARAFDPFFTTKPLGQGTGLGLSMVHGFARQSGGQVHIYSEVGKGTTLCLYLPRFNGVLDEENPASDPGSDLPAEGETVMVIDDEEAILDLITEVLTEAGYRVLQAVDGPSGLKVLESDVAIDLLITDVGLPGGMNGRQVADAARVRRPDLKVLFVTGYAENAAVGNGLLAPGMQVITKPFAMTALAGRVREIIEG